MKYVICDIKPTNESGSCKYIKGEMIDLRFFKDEEHRFTYNRIEGESEGRPLWAYWEYMVGDDTKIIAFPTLSEMNKRPGDWIGEIMESLKISNEDLSNICFILHDKDFGDEWYTAFDDEQAPKYVYCQDKGFVVSDNNAESSECGKLFLFQHDTDDNFFKQIAFDTTTWEERWMKIKELIQW